MPWLSSGAGGGGGRHVSIGSASASVSSLSAGTSGPGPRERGALVSSAIGPGVAASSASTPPHAISANASATGPGDGRVGGDGMAADRTRRRRPDRTRPVAYARAMSRLQWVLRLSLLCSLAPGCASGGGGGVDSGTPPPPTDSGSIDSALPGIDAGPPPSCGEGCSSLDSDCAVGVCDEATDVCRAEPRPDGTPCDDANACTSMDSCVAGACAGVGTDCTGLDDACNAGACDPTTGACTAMPRPDGTSCDDGVPCTSPDTCTGGACAGPPTDCSASADMCNTGMCNATTGACQAVPVTDGTACDDGDPSTSGDVCTAGVCAGSSGCRWLFISQESQATDAAILRLFTDNGHTVDSRTSNGTSGVHSSNASLLGMYSHVVFHQHDRVLSSAESTALTNFINTGGRLIVTGYDSLGSPTDSVLASLVRCASPGDGPFSSALSVTDATHPIAMGPAQTFTSGMSLTSASTDHDQCTPNGGARRIVTVSGSSKLQITEGIGAGGMVVYWNGNGVTSGALVDWNGSSGTQPALQNLFVNVLDHLCR